MTYLMAPQQLQLLHLQQAGNASRVKHADQDASLYMDAELAPGLSGDDWDTDEMEAPTMQR